MYCMTAGALAEIGKGVVLLAFGESLYTCTGLGEMLGSYRFRRQRRPTTSRLCRQSLVLKTACTAVAATSQRHPPSGSAPLLTGSQTFRLHQPGCKPHGRVKADRSVHRPWCAGRDFVGSPG
ncbi:hypothetical protein N658DRAFT_222812 [Parathielavia hyrcaniae]|uniref:Uncharacterized protein n=1 Tax=Parathielavia hyrcaniae TaxID=113614 RepID=A0AAN6PUY6_9PEZI|nr:hypothetical protein N658DRAFT_222812 [Parathielavia hyrcaniae]